LQQPFGQLAALHAQAEPVQYWPAAQAKPRAPQTQSLVGSQTLPRVPQAEQSAPSWPHSVTLVAVTQLLLPSQQPVQPVFASQTQVAERQAWPVEQAAMPPQVQLPVVDGAPHASASPPLQLQQPSPPPPQ
jgi:hypothetical protein